MGKEESPLNLVAGTKVADIVRKKAIELGITEAEYWKRALKSYGYLEKITTNSSTKVPDHEGETHCFWR